MIKDIYATIKPTANIPDSYCFFKLLLSVTRQEYLLSLLVTNFILEILLIA